MTEESTQGPWAVVTIRYSKDAGRGVDTIQHRGSLAECAVVFDLFAKHNSSEERVILKRPDGKPMLTVALKRGYAQ